MTLRLFIPLKWKGQVKRIAWWDTVFSAVCFCQLHIGNFGNTLVFHAYQIKQEAVVYFEFRTAKGHC